MGVCVWIWLCVCMCNFKGKCIGSCIWLHVCIHTHTHTPVCMHLYVYVYVCVRLQPHFQRNRKHSFPRENDVLLHGRSRTSSAAGARGLTARTPGSPTDPQVRSVRPRPSGTTSNTTTLRERLVTLPAPAAKPVVRRVG